jgi:hypothetical protein
MDDEHEDRRQSASADASANRAAHAADRHVERTAQELIDIHGCDQAAVEAAHQAQTCVNEGDQKGCQRWMTILQTIRSWYDTRTTGMITF